MAIDDSFKKPGAVPFKWEIRPGVPKIQQKQTSCDHRRPCIQHQRQEGQQKQESDNHNRSSLRDTSQKLRPPPAGLYFQPPMEPRTNSFRSAPRTRSERYRFDRAILARSESVSTSCLPGPLLWHKYGKKRAHKHKPQTVPEPDYTSDLETLSRWSVSTRKTLSPFLDSPSSSSFSSYQSSPRPVGDAEWAGFGLF